MALTVVEVVQAARDKLERCGRSVGATDGLGRVCLLNALLTVSYDLEAGDEIHAAAIRALAVYTPDRYAVDVPDSMKIMAFNDAPETTDRDVFDVIDKTLADLGAS